MTTLNTNIQTTSAKTEIDFAKLVNGTVTVFRKLVTSLRPERHEPFYHNHKAAQIERARRDVNRLWTHGGF